MDLPDFLRFSKYKDLPIRNFFSSEPVHEINQILSLLFEDLDHLKRTVERLLGPIFHEDYIKIEPSEKTLNGLMKLDDFLKSVHQNLGGPEISHDFKVVESFSTPEGKFGDQLGNAVVIDCKYIDDYYSPTIHRLLENLPPVLGLENILKADEDIFCNYALNVVGVLDNQVDTYTLGKRNMKHKLSVAGNDLIGALTYDANITVTTPLEQQLKSVSMITVFMNTIMATIVAFLAILCA